MAKKASNPDTVFINEGLQSGRLLKFNALQSTNQWAIENIRTLGHGDTVWAIAQTAGYGRFDRQWISPGNLSLTASIIMTPPPDSELFISIITQLAALAVVATLEKSSIQAMVKWPNDVLVNGKKIAGILAERDQETGMIALGIGLNVNMTATDFMKAELIQPATSMKLETNINFKIRKILKTLISELEKTFGVTKNNESSFPLAAWQQKDYLAGRRISIHTASDVISGLYSGVDESGRLLLTDDDGAQHQFWSGDVSVQTEHT